MPDTSTRARLVYPPVSEVLEKQAKVFCAYMQDMELYFRVGDADDGETDAGGWQDINATHTVKLTLYYYDSGSEAITVTYTGDGTTEYTETVVTKGNTGVWKRGHHTLAHAARFNHSLYTDFEYADFYLACDNGPLYIGELTVKDTVTKAVAVWQATDDVQAGSLEFQSDNFVTGSAGFYINGDTGDAEFNNVVVRGTIYATAGEIGGFSIGATYVRDAADSFGLASVVTAGDDVRFWAGATYANRATAPARVTEAGAATFTSATITGSVTATGGAIGGFHIDAVSVHDAADSFGLASTVTGGDDVRFWAGDTYANRATADFRVTESGAVTASSITITGGSVATVTLNDAVQQFTSDIVWTITDADTVAWANNGHIRVMDGTVYTISPAGNTGNMAATTYIYLDVAVSTTALQVTTTYSNAVGDGKILVAVAANGAVKAAVWPVNTFGIINAEHISTTTLSAISANLGTITAGTVTGATIQTAASGARVLMDTTALYGYDASNGVWAFAVSDGVSWNGETINKGDMVIGNAASGGNLFYDASTGAIYVRFAAGKLFAFDPAAESFILDQVGASPGYLLTFKHSGSADTSSYARVQFDATNATKVLSLDVYNGAATRTWTFGSDQLLTVPNSGKISEIAAGSKSYTASAGNNNNIDTAGVTTLLCTNSPGNFTLTGFAGAYEGKFLTFIYTGTSNVTVSNADANSDAGNRIVMSDASSPVSTGVCYLSFQYLNSRWRLLSSAL